MCFETAVLSPKEAGYFEMLKPEVSSYGYFEVSRCFEHVETRVHVFLTFELPLMNWKHLYNGTFQVSFQISGVTPPKFDIAPEKWWLEDYFPIGKVTFQGLC